MSDIYQWLPMDTSAMHHPQIVDGMRRLEEDLITAKINEPRGIRRYLCAVLIIFDRQRCRHGHRQWLSTPCDAERLQRSEEQLQPEALRLQARPTHFTVDSTLVEN